MWEVTQLAVSECQLSTFSYSFGSERFSVRGNPEPEPLSQIQIGIEIREEHRLM